MLGYWLNISLAEWRDVIIWTLCLQDRMVTHMTNVGNTPFQWIILGNKLLKHGIFKF